VIGRKRWAPWVWLSPAILLLSTFLVYPVIDTVRRSFQDARSDNWVGFDNYQFIIDNRALRRRYTRRALEQRSLDHPLPRHRGAPRASHGRSHVPRRYESAAKSAVFIPMAISFVAAGVIWKFMYEFNSDIGTLNAVLSESSRDPVAWLQDTRGLQRWATDAGPETMWGPLQINNFAIVTVGVWMWTGFALVVLSAALKGIPTEILEAARVDGASEWQIFWRIMLPSLMPTILVVATTLVIQSLKIFDLIWVMTGGRFETDVVATLFFKQAFVARNFGVGAALAVILLVAVVPAMIVSVQRFQRRRQDDGPGPGPCAIPPGRAPVRHPTPSTGAHRSTSSCSASSCSGASYHRPAGELVPRTVEIASNGWWNALTSPLDLRSRITGLCWMARHGRAFVNTCSSRRPAPCWSSSWPPWPRTHSPG
jgi:alpha-glucoside transport system permease protein